MSTGKPWYVTVFERDWHDRLAPGGSRSAVDPATYAEQTEREVGFVAGTLDLPPASAVLDLCCGWGRHTVGLARRGLHMTGLDLSGYHIELATSASRGAGVDVQWIEGDMRHVPAPDGSFDAVINLFTAFGYFDDTENQRVLEEVSRVLAPGGQFLIDVINRDYLMRVFRESEWQEQDDGYLILQRRRWHPETGRIHAAWTIIEPDGTRRTHAHDERIYSLQELEVRLSLAGLRVGKTFGDLEGGPFRFGSRRLVVLAEKA